MKLNLLPKKLLPFMLIPVLSLAGGCENQFDINKAQEFGKTAENFEQAYKGIVEDIYDSCMRKARFVTPITETERIKRTREDAENECVSFAQYENQLLRAHEVLAKYTEAFRELSSDEIIKELDGAKKLAESLANLPIPGLKEASPVIAPIAGELAGAIQKALESQFRGRVLDESVKEVNTEIQKYIATLADITDETYTDLLRLEEAEMNKYYSEVVRQELNKTFVERSGNVSEDSEGERRSNPVQVSVLLVDKQWQEDRKEANYPEKFAKIHFYLETLKKMANLHQELYVSVQESQ